MRLHRTALLLALLLAALLALPASSSARTLRCAQVNVEAGPDAEGSATNIRATGLSCRTARRVARYYLCHNRPPRGWREVGPESFPVVLRNGRWRVSFNLAGGSVCG